MKRFWKTVDVEKKGDALTVTLDKRPLKTPSGNQLLVPPHKKLVATLIASEWENQLTLLKPHALPMVCFFLHDSRACVSILNGTDFAHSTGY